MNAAGVYTFNPENPSEPWSSALIVQKTSAECAVNQQASLATGSASISVDATSGVYEIYALFRAPSINASINISLDGGTIVYKEFYGDSVYNPIYITLYSDLNLGIDADYMQPCNEVTINLNPVLMWWCSDALYDIVANPATLSVTSGNAYALIKTSDTTYSDHVAFNLKDPNNQFTLAGTGVWPPIGEPAMVIIQAEVGNFIKNDTIMLGSIQPYDLHVEAYPSDIKSGDGMTAIYVEERDTSGSAISCDPDRLITLSVDNAAYGSFRDTAGNKVANSVTAKYKDVNEGKIEYFADETPVCTDAMITVTASSPGLVSGEMQLYIHPADPCLLVTMSPDTISPGDTVSIMIKRSSNCDPVEDFPAGHIFNAQIVEGSEYGKWLSNDGTLREYFICDSLGFKFIAADTLSQNSVQVKFAFYPNCDAAATTTFSENSRISEGVSPIASTVDTIKTIVKNKKASPQRKLSSGSCQAEPKVTIEKGEPELIVHYNTEDLEIDATPQMPQNKKLQAEVKNYEGGVSYHWEVDVEWKGVKVTTGPYPYSGDVVASSSGLVDLPLIWDSKIRGGKNITVKVTATAGEYEGTVEIEKPFNILGENPYCQTVKTYVDNKAGTNATIIKAITFCESGYKQFKSNPNTPYEGYPDQADIGICQIHHPTDGDQVWNWQKNVDGGINVFNYKKNVVNEYVDHIKNGKCWYLYRNPVTDKDEWKQNQPCPQLYYGDKTQQFKYNPTALTNEQELKEIIQRYTGGVHWKWVAKDPKYPLGAGTWKEEPSQKAEYVEKVWPIYKGEESDGCHQ